MGTVSLALSVHIEGQFIVSPYGTKLAKLNPDGTLLLYDKLLKVHWPLAADDVQRLAAELRAAQDQTTDLASAP